jgi:hypothetical protein
MAGDQAQNKPAEHERAESKNAVANDSHSTELIHSAGLEKFRGPGVPRTLLNGRPRLH